MRFELFPGFKVPPTDPSRELKLRPALRFCAHLDPREVEDSFGPEDNEDDGDCSNCEGHGYTDCFCGGDLCVCDYYGEIPCYHCA